MTDKLIPAVFYGRASTSKQEASVDHQRIAVTEYAAKHGYKLLAREYLDDGVSGDDFNRRKGFQRMLRDAGDKEGFQAILCFTLDRFGRFDSLDAGYYTKPLRDRGIYVVSTDRGVWDWKSLAGRITYALEAEMKHGVEKDMSTRTQVKLTLLVKDGGWPNRAPYGYTIARRPHPNWNNQVNPAKRGLPYLVPSETAEVVREIFQRSATGRETGTQGRIAASVNDRGIPSPTGVFWSQAMIRSILLNEAYLGRTVYGRASRSKYSIIVGGTFVEASHNDKKLRHNAETDRMVRESTHEALIELETWNAVQRRLAKDQERSRNGTKYSTPSKACKFVFTGLLICENCGYRMQGHAYPRSGGTGKGYFCSGYNGRGRKICRNRWVNEAFLVNLVSDQLWHQLFMEQKGMPSLQVRLRDWLKEFHAKPPSNVAALKKELASIQKKSSQGMERYVTDEHLSPDMRKDLAKKLDGLKAQEKDLRAKVQGAEAASNLRSTIDQRVEEFIQKIMGMNAVATDGGFTVDQIKQIVAEVRIQFANVGERRSAIRQVLVKWDTDSLIGSSLFPEFSSIFYALTNDTKTSRHLCL